MEEPGRLQSMGSLRVGHNWATSLSLFTFMDWRRKWQPTPLFLPGESQGQGVWWAAVYGVAQSGTQLSDFTFTFHFHGLEKEMATNSSVLAWRIPGMGEPGGLPSMGSHKVGRDWSDLAAAAAYPIFNICLHHTSFFSYHWIIFSFSWIPLHCKLHRTYLFCHSYLCVWNFFLYTNICAEKMLIRESISLCAECH